MIEAIRVSRGPGRGGTVHVGEYDISGAAVVLELAALITTVGGAAVIKLSKRTEAALVALGWTPPESTP